jgi:hypothetical protein
MSVLDREIGVRLFPVFPAITGEFDEDRALNGILLPDGKLASATLPKGEDAP